MGVRSQAQAENADAIGHCGIHFSMKKKPGDFPREGRPFFACEIFFEESLVQSSGALNGDNGS